MKKEYNQTGYQNNKAVTESKIVYCVDRLGTIVSIEGPWDEFAAGNDGASLSREQTLGHTIFDFLTGDGVQETYRIFHGKLFDEPSEKITFGYRCDSPECRRDMSMVMEKNGDLISYTSTLVSIAPKSEPLNIDYAAKDGKVVTMCAWCKDFRLPEDPTQWRSMDSVFQINSEPFSISHGICPQCSAKFDINLPK